MTENWRRSEFLKGYYLVSDMGRIKTFNYMNTGRERILNAHMDRKGYLRIGLISASGKLDTFKVHRLVYMTFNPGANPETINHRNCIKTDNRLENLEAMSNRDNVIHGIINDRYSDKKLSWGMAEYMRLLNDAGVERKELCKMFNVSNTTVGKVIHGETYAWADTN